MRKWVVGLILILGLAACNGEDESDPPANTPVADNSVATESATASVEAVSTADVESTDEPALPPGQVMEPGVRVEEGVEVINSNAYISPAGSGWVLLELRNGNEEPVPNFLVTVSLLDDQNREIGMFNIVTPMVNIPAGYTVPVVAEFVAPEGYTNFMALATVDRSVEESPFVGEYDLPATIEVEVDGTFNRVTGTLTNDRGMDLILPIATIALYEEDQLVGVAQAILNGTDERGQWLDGAILNFEAAFPFLPTTNITDSKVVSVAYQIPGQ